MEEKAANEGQGLLVPAKCCQIKWVTFSTFYSACVFTLQLHKLGCTVMDAILRGPAHNQ